MGSTESRAQPTVYHAGVRPVSPVVRHLESGICPVCRYGVYCQAMAAHKHAGELKRSIEQAYEQRDALPKPVDVIVCPEPRRAKGHLPQRTPQDRRVRFQRSSRVAQQKERNGVSKKARCDLTF